ncbi:hypothetical protein [Enorma phocaeensis]|uniref:hypothetical protein n=1 Tax=Enorma phocaeensis TaxID=1871019 RepID=UPI002357E697|nr:hypothetical protein [Enorma phocaeensis]
MLFEALPIIIVTALVIEAVSYFIPAVKNLVGVVGPILIVLGATGWMLLGSPAALIVAGIVVIVARYIFVIYLVKHDQE